MKTKILQWLAILMIVQVGLVHFLTAQQQYDEAVYMGFLFIGNFSVSLLAAYGIFRQKPWGWILGIAVVLGSLAGYAWSRTIGMPGMEVEAWDEPMGVISMVVEGSFLLICLALFLSARQTAIETGNGWFEQTYLAPMAIVVMMIFFSIVIALGDTSKSSMANMNLVQADDLLRASQLTNVELEEKYGVQITQVSITALSSIVDVRLKIIDPQKAHLLLDKHPILFVDNQNVIHPPHLHTHSELKAGKIFVMFFPASKATIHPGSHISLAFERVDQPLFTIGQSNSFVTEPVIVK